MCVCVCRKFNKTIEILQGDIETLENEKIAAERKLDQEAQKAMRVDTTSTRRLRGSSFGNALGLREMRGGAEGAAGAQQPGVQQAPVDAAAASPLILARVCHQSGKYRHTNSKKRKAVCYCNSSPCVFRKQTHHKVLYKQDNCTQHGTLT